MDIEKIHQYYENVLDDYIEGHFGTEYEIKKLYEVLMQLDKLYQEGRSTPLSDSEYDKLYEIYVDLSGNIIRGDMHAKTKIKHDYPMLKGTLKKVHYITQKEKDNDPTAIDAHKVLFNWYKDTLSKLDRNKDHYLGFWFKYDGCSVIMSLSEEKKYGRDIERAITRGDEDIGIDKSSLFTKIKLAGIIPKEFPGKIGLKTEVIMPRSLFDEYNKKFAGDKPFATPRNAMTSLLNSETFTELHRKFICVKPLLMNYNNEFKSFTMDDEMYGPSYSIPHKKHTVLDESEMEEIIMLMKDAINKGDFDCDGVVVRWYDEDAMRTLGRDETNYVNNFEIAYKFPRERQYTKIIDIKQDIGLMGKLSLTAVFEPITFNNRVVTHASLGSYDRAKKLALGKGDMVGIQYEIVPYLYLDEWCREHPGDSDPIPLLTECPYCHSTLELNPEMSCVNPDCPSRIQGKIYNFCVRVGLTGIGEALIESLFQAGLVTSIEDLFSLKKHEDEFSSIEGLGHKTWKKICNQIDKLELDEATILASVGIKSLGPKNSKKITNIYYINELLEMCGDNIDKGVIAMEGKGITHHMATITMEGVVMNRKLLHFLMTHVKIKKSEKDPDTEVVFTGFRNSKFQKYLMDKHQIAVADSVKKTTRMLIAENPNHLTGKLKKAIELGVPIVSVPEAYEIFGFKI